MIIATIPALVMVAGVLMYALAANPKLAEIGRIMFAFGPLVALIVLDHAGARVFP